jgi:hypothetical protein
MHHNPILMTGWLILAICILSTTPIRTEAAAGIVTVPMQLELNRPYVEVELTGPDGHRAHALAWVDTGGGAIILSHGLAHKLGLQPNAKPHDQTGPRLAPTATPQVAIGDMPIRLSDPQTFVELDAPHGLNDTGAEMALPGRMLRGYIMELDYPARRFTLAAPNKLRPAGIRIKTFIGAAGMPVVLVDIDGKPYRFLMDTGGQYCMLSARVLHALQKQHPDWPSVTGAYGPADMLLGKPEAKFQMLRIGSLQWGRFRITGVGVVSRPYGNYEKFMSQVAGRAVIGSIAGNLLREFRVTVDYPAGVVYLEHERAGHAAPLAMVGVILEAAPQGGYVVAGTMADMRGIHAGDRLLAIDGQNVGQAPFYKVVGMLSGKPGETRRLTLLRRGNRISIKARIEPIF